MSTLKKNAPITVALKWRGPVHREQFPHGLSRTHVLQLGETRFSAHEDDRVHHEIADEGITWVRGHVADDSPEGQALLAANALAPADALTTFAGDDDTGFFRSSDVAAAVVVVGGRVK